MKTFILTTLLLASSLVIGFYNQEILNKEYEIFNREFSVLLDELNNEYSSGNTISLNQSEANFLEQLFIQELASEKSIW